MATYGDEPVDGYFYSSYGPYAARYPRAKDAAAGWKYKSYLSRCGDAADAFNNQQRAQLKSILSQINPKLTPRLRKANTKDVAVQVNPRRDAQVQCSLGPRTLLAWKRDSGRRRRQEPAATLGGGVSPKAAAGVRYPRNLAVYSPIAYRSVTSFLVEENENNTDENNNSNPNSKEASCGDAQAGEPPADPPDAAVRRAGKRRGGDRAAEDGKTAKPQEQREDPESKREEAEELLLAADGSKGKARVRFQVSLVT